MLLLLVWYQRRITKILIRVCKMNQSNLYSTLNQLGCKILSFEDYPSSQGSWRVSFMAFGNYCEVSCNRFDGYMSLGYKNSIHGAHQSTINTLKFLTDEAELSALLRWLRSLSSKAKTVESREMNTEQLLPESTY